MSNTQHQAKQMKKEARKYMFSALGRLMKYITGIYKFQFITLTIGLIAKKIKTVVI